MTGTSKPGVAPSTDSGFSLSSMIRSFGEESEFEKPFMPLVGGPRLFILLLYASVIVVVSIQYFAGQDLWPGAWEMYNTYTLVVTGVFVFLGMLMLFSSERKVTGEYTLPVPRVALASIGFAMLGLSGVAIVYWGDELGGWAIPLSIMLVYGFLMMLLGGRGFETREVIKLTGYATGLILMIMVPVHESFGYYASPQDDFLFTLLNLVLLASGMFIALVSAQSLQSRDSYIGAWLIGAMAIFLIAFHEQIGIVASGDYSVYDRTLALIGVTFSFLPLAMYVWRERVYIFLWRKLKTANQLIEAGDYETALKQAEAAIKQCARVGIEDRFALPWSTKADALYRMREYRKAAVFYDTALKIDPKDSASWSNLGNIYALEGRQEEALKAFSEALKADPTNGYAWNNKGAVYQTLRMYQDALICFDKAIFHMPDKFDSHMNMAKLLSKMGHSSDALRHYQEAIVIRPNSNAAREGVHREFHRSACLDQINGWEQMGLETSQLRKILDEDPLNFLRLSKEILADIVDKKQQLSVLPSIEHVDVQRVMQQILTLTGGGAKQSGDDLARCPKCNGLVTMKDTLCPNCGAEFEIEVEPPGATLQQIEEATGLSRRELVLPLALLMETDRLHFKTVGRKQVYASAGRAPEEPPPIPPPVKPSPPPAPEPAAPAPPPPQPEPKPEPAPPPEPPVAPAPTIPAREQPKEELVVQPRPAKVKKVVVREEEKVKPQKPRPVPKEEKKPAELPKEKPKAPPKGKPPEEELEAALVEEEHKTKRMREVVTVEPTASILVFSRRPAPKPEKKAVHKPEKKPAKKPETKHDKKKKKK